MMNFIVQIIKIQNQEEFMKCIPIKMVFKREK